MTQETEEAKEMFDAEADDADTPAKRKALQMYKRALIRGQEIGDEMLQVNCGSLSYCIARCVFFSFQTSFFELIS